MEFRYFTLLVTTYLNYTHHHHGEKVGYQREVYISAKEFHLKYRSTLSTTHLEIPG